MSDEGPRAAAGLGPEKGQRIYRPDLGASFTYDGSRWISDVDRLRAADALAAAVVNYERGAVVEDLARQYRALAAAPDPAPDER